MNSNLIDDAWTNTMINPVNVIYTIDPVSAEGCKGTSFTVTITVNPEPVVSNQALTVCSDVACGLLLGNDLDGPTASTYNIISINSNGLSASAGTPLVSNGLLNSDLMDDAWTNTTNLPVNVVYTLVPISALGCEGTPFTVTITINPEPVVLNQVLTVCSDVVSGLTLGNDLDGPPSNTYNIIGINSNGLSSSAGTPIVANGLLNSNLIDDVWENTTNNAVNVIYNVNPVSSAGCIGNTFSTTITVNPEPVFNAPDAEVCADHYVTLTGSPSSYSYSWDHGVNNNVPFAPLYTDTYNVVAINTITGCSQSSSAVVTVHPNPIADFIQNWNDLMSIFTNTSSGAVN